jgi:hypothetical protein
MPEPRISAQPLHLESDAWVQRLTMSFDGLGHALIIHTTRDELEARRLAMTVQPYLSSAFAEAWAEAAAQQAAPNIA